MILFFTRLDHSIILLYSHITTDMAINTTVKMGAHRYTTETGASMHQRESLPDVRCVLTYKSQPPVREEDGGKWSQRLSPSRGKGEQTNKKKIKEVKGK